MIIICNLAVTVNYRNVNQTDLAKQDMVVIIKYDDLTYDSDGVHILEEEIIKEKIKTTDFYKRINRYYPQNNIRYNIKSINIDRDSK